MRSMRSSSAFEAAATDLTVPCSDWQFEVTAMLLTLFLDPVVSLFFFFSIILRKS
jgi:hypothetical protein